MICPSCGKKTIFVAFALGRRTEAEGWFRSLSERSPIELIYRASAQERIRSSAGT